MLKSLLNEMAYKKGESCDPIETQNTPIIQINDIRVFFLLL